MANAVRVLADRVRSLNTAGKTRRGEKKRDGNENGQFRLVGGQIAQ